MPSTVRQAPKTTPGAVTAKPTQTTKPIESPGFKYHVLTGPSLETAPKPGKVKIVVPNKADTKIHTYPSKTDTKAHSYPNETLSAPAAEVESTPPPTEPTTANVHEPATANLQSTDNDALIAEEEARRRAEEKARKRAEARARAEAAKQAREESKARASQYLGYENVQPIDGGSRMSIADPRVTSELIATLAALIQDKAKNLSGDAGPECFADLCGEAAKRAAEEARKALEEAEEQAREAAEEEAREAAEEAERQRQEAEDEMDARERRRNRSPESRRRTELEDELDERRNDLEEEGEDLRERGEDIADRQEDLNEEERRLRREEGELRRNDPNCRSAACQAKRAERAANSQAITELARETGRFQADQARFQGQMQDYARDMDRLDRMNDSGYGMTRDEFRSHQASRLHAEAQGAVNDLQGDINNLRDEQLRLRQQGGSGSTMDRALDQEINRLEQQLGNAQDAAARAGEVAVRANAHAMGLGAQYDTYREASGGLEAQRQVNIANDALYKAERHLNDLQSSGAGRGDIRDAERAVRDARRTFDAASDARGEFNIGDPRRAVQTITDFSEAYNDAQRLSQMSTSDLQQQADIARQAQDYINAARDGVGGQVPPPSGSAFERLGQLEGEKAELQGRLDEMDDKIREAMSRGPVFASDFLDARTEILNDMAQVDSQLSQYSAIGEAKAFGENINRLNGELNSFAQGLPRDANGKIDEAILAQQVQVMGQAQIELSKLTRQMNGLQAQAASGELSSGGQAKLDALQSATREITGELAGMGVDITVSDGALAVDNATLAGAVSWNAAQQSVATFMAAINQTKQKVASLRNQPPPKDLFATPGKASTNGPTLALTTRRTGADGSQGQSGQGSQAGEGTRVADTETPVQTASLTDGLGGNSDHQRLLAVHGEVSQSAQRINADAETAASQPPAERVDEERLARLRGEAAADRERAEQLARQTRVARGKAEDAQDEAARQRREADRRREHSDEFTPDRDRQAGEWNELSDRADARADEFETRADDVRGDADGLRQAADRYRRLSETTEDPSLAGDALRAAQDLDRAARDLDREAAHLSDEASRERRLAHQRTDSGDRIREDASQLRSRAATAEDVAEQAESEAARRFGRVEGLGAETTRAGAEAHNSQAALEAAQSQNFRAMLNEPPSATFWSDMSSAERGDWMRDNVPGWDRMGINQQVRVLQTTDFSEARVQAVEAATAFDTFVQQHDLSEESIEARIESIQTLESQIEQAENEWVIDSDDQNNLRRLRGQLGRERRSLTSELHQVSELRDQAIEASQEYSRQLWGLDDDARQTEVDRRVAGLAETRGQLDLARHAAEVRDQAFAERIEAERSRLQTAQTSGDTAAADAAQTALDRLGAAQTEWRQLDDSNIRTLENIYETRRTEVVGQSIDAGLFELTDSDRLDQLAEDRLRVSGTLRGSQERQDAAVRTAVNQVDVTPEEFSVSRMVIDIYDSATTTVATTAGVATGVVVGAAKGIYGFFDLVIWEPIDSIGKFAEGGMEVVTGSRTNIFGTDNQDFVNQASGDLSGTAFDMVIGLGKQVHDFTQDVQHLGEAIEAGDAGHAFDASMRATTFIAENVIDPSLLIGGVGKLGKLGAVANVVGDAARLADPIADAARLGNIGEEAASLAGTAARHGDISGQLPGANLPPAGTTRLPPPDLPPAGTARLDPFTPPPAGSASAASAGSRGVPPPAAGSVTLPPPGALGASDLTRLEPPPPAAGSVTLPPPGALGASDLTRLEPPPPGAVPGAHPPPVVVPAGALDGSGTLLDGAPTPGSAAATPHLAARADGRVVTVGHGPNGGIVVQRSAGGQVDGHLNFGSGDKLGEGSFSAAYGVPGSRAGSTDNLGQVAKLTRAGDGALDDLGRAAIEGLADPLVIRTPAVIDQYPITGSVTVAGKHGPVNYRNGTLTILEETPASFKDQVVNGTIPHIDGAMTPGQAIAFSQGMDALNQRGFAWLDNKSDNFTFVANGPPGSDNWTLVVIDPGGIVPVTAGRGVSAADNASALQHAVDNPSPAFRERYARGSLQVRYDHMRDIAVNFDEVVNWDSVRAATDKDLRTLGNFDEFAEGQFLPYNPKNGADFPKLGEFRDLTNQLGDVHAAEDALRGNHPLPPNNPGIAPGTGGSSIPGGFPGSSDVPTLVPGRQGWLHDFIMPAAQVHALPAFAANDIVGLVQAAA